MGVGGGELYYMTADGCAVCLLDCVGCSVGGVRRFVF